MILPSFDDILTIAATVAVGALWVALGLVGCGMIAAFVCFAARLAWAMVSEALVDGTIVSVRSSTLPPPPPPKGDKDSRNHETTEETDAADTPDKGATPRPSEGRGAEGGVGSASETDAKGAPQATIDRLLAMREPVKLMPVLPQLSKNQRDSLRERSKKLYRRAMFHEQNGCCSLCHKPMAIDKSQMHHVMPLERFPELGVVRGNLMLLCADCHFDIHHNPFLDSRLMIERATALGIDLSKRYKLPE